ncbi:MAG: domain containing protein, partial [Verrucomicrobiales bacterium]|nr:domain containing protein [Verrucomicrobiales bacterium]
LELDKWTPDDIAGWHSFTLPLTANVSVPFRVEYAEFYGGANITVFWYSNTQPWEAIAPARFTLASTSGQNLPPVLTSPGDQASVRTRGVSLQPIAMDPESNPLIWSASGLPEGLSINAASGRISGTVSPAASDSNNTSVSVFDGNSTSTATFSWSTSAPPANRAATLQNPGTQTSIRGSIVSFSVLANDPDDDALTWSAVGLPAGLSLNSVTGLISGTILNGAATSYGVTVTVTDPGGLSASVPFTWNTVAPPLHGLRAEYFDGLVPGAAAPILVRTDSAIDFDWGGGSPAPSVPVDYFSVRWTGSLTAPYSETFTFWVPSDNGVRVWINNQLVLDKWTPDTIAGWHTFNATLTAGATVPFKVEYAELYGGANIAVYWYSNTQAWEAIGTEKLTPAVVLPPNSALTATTMIAATQRLSLSPGPDAAFSFSRPSSSASMLALVVETSTDLVNWEVSDLPAEVSPTAEGTDRIRIRIPEPGSLGGAECRYFRVHMLVPPTPGS